MTNLHTPPDNLCEGGCGNIATPGYLNWSESRLQERYDEYCEPCQDDMIENEGDI